MKKYNIEIEEILQRVVKVEANNKEDALKTVKQKYENEEIILDHTDFKDVLFK